MVDAGECIDLFCSQPAPRGITRPAGEGAEGGLLDKLQLVDDLVHVWALPVLRPVVHIDRAGG